ncbi:hypothetical protein A2954_05580 [Candidatus Roizmanbacteria bacterium RIFCSPLOWO2_01_FULL_37_12]|uniref:Uncharacterized protein n=1 Tax=Candidatus Roizmanbacteria bacterium RIFCSPLOWO2_01_FULL_37_12 TaxID=1802056 RepID=A0A1F7IBH3_9BACT|nr:MAG: hypothetical protein A2954_05580 [Candidatus Roizmanbacteria bacterium RIFCSPLOWO2_01_FULL_37_12]
MLSYLLVLLVLLWIVGAVRVPAFSPINIPLLYIGGRGVGLYDILVFCPDHLVDSDFAQSDSRTGYRIFIHLVVVIFRRLLLWRTVQSSGSAFNPGPTNVRFRLVLLKVGKKSHEITCC